MEWARVVMDIDVAIEGQSWTRQLRDATLGTRTFAEQLPRISRPWNVSAGWSVHRFGLSFPELSADDVTTLTHC